MTTREKLVAAAEKLFASQGFAGTSVREITHAVGANLAAVSYHFGSKDGLLRAVVERHAAPLGRERLERIELTRTAAGSRPPTPESVMRAFCEPILRARRDNPHFMALMSRVHNENLFAIVGEVVREHFYQPLLLAVEVLAESLPEVPREEIHGRLLFTVGSMIFLNQRLPDCEQHLGLGPMNMDLLADQLLHFCTQGVMAPPASVTDPGGGS